MDRWVLVAVLLTGCGSSSQVAATPSPSPAPSISPEPSYTSASAYLKIWDGDWQAWADVNGAKCVSVADCQGWERLTLAAVEDFQRDLNKMTAPPCLAEMDQETRAGLPDVAQGLRQAIAAQRGSDIDAARVVMDRGFAHTNRARTLRDRTYCPNAG